MKNFSENDLLNMRDYFISLLGDIPDERLKVSKEDLIAFLDKNEFFTSPASTKYHSCIKGGLCFHSLQVYDNIMKLNDLKGMNYSKDSLAIVSLLHDISKAGFYKNDIRNKKIYSPTGSKHDNGGNFDWVAVEGFAVKDWDERFILGTHEVNSMYLVSRMVNLTTEEAAALANHHGGYDKPDYYDVSQVFYKYPLAFLLHTADSIAAYLDEDITNE